MTEWRLFDSDTPAEFSTPQFFEHYPWIDPVWQVGHANRIEMVADLATEVMSAHGLRTLVDLGCGDGSLLSLLERRLGDDVTMWGYDLGRGNLQRATGAGVDARYANILTDSLDWADLVVCTEVVEHLYDPRAFVRSIPGTRLILSSPGFEDDVTHYEHHAWAWDWNGYREMIADCGWTPVEQRRSPEGFQAVYAMRPA